MIRSVISVGAMSAQTAIAIPTTNQPSFFLNDFAALLADRVPRMVIKMTSSMPNRHAGPAA
jgi:hypothetical protein